MLPAALVMKASEVRQMMNLAARANPNVFKTDTKHAILNGDIGAEVICIRHPDWWPEQVPKGYALQLMKSVYGTRHCSQWHFIMDGRA